MVASARTVDGTCEPGFEGVRSAFEENFNRREEVGASVAVYVDGHPVVDLWGGVTIHQGERSGPWERDTLTCLFSLGKTPVALSAHRLVDQGLLQYEERVAHYWPEFAQAGKQDVTVRQLMGGLASLPYPDGVEDGKALDWDGMVDGLARTPPAWPVGTRGAYHGATYGHLVGELVRRVSGRTPEAYFREEIAEPLGIDFWFQVPPAERHRVSEVLPNPASLAGQVAAGMREKVARAWGRILPFPDPVGVANDPRYAHEVMPSALGRGNARAMGKLYAALSLGGSLDGCTVLSPGTLGEATTPQWEGQDPVTDRYHRYGLGFFLNSPPHVPMGPNPASFGHMGATSSLAFADPDRRISFCHCSNYLAAGSGVGDRCEALIGALYASIES